MSRSEDHPQAIAQILRASLGDRETTARLLSKLPDTWQPIVDDLRDGKERAASVRIAELSSSFEKRGGAPFSGFYSQDHDIEPRFRR